MSTGVLAVGFKAMRNKKGQRAGMPEINSLLPEKGGVSAPAVLLCLFYRLCPLLFYEDASVYGFQRTLSGYSGVY